MNRPDQGLSRRDTSARKVAYLQPQLPLGVGRAAWTRRVLHLRVAESRADRGLVATVVRERHYLQAWPTRPRTLILSYLADLVGVERGPAGAAGMAMVALLPGRYHVLSALDVAQHEALSLVRLWRADDLGPQLAPDLTPELLRRVIRGERGRGPLRCLREEWVARKCREGGLRAAPRLLLTYADPAQGHDGATYLAAGATGCGPGAGGKLLFAWALDPRLQQPLQAWAAARAERGDR